MQACTYLIIGAGFGGLGMGIRLKQSGQNDFAIWEKAGDLGGCWRDNVYPGAACDVPSHLYSFSFAPKKDWTYKFAPQAEILDYMRECATEHGLRPHLHFKHEVALAEYDEARHRWQVTSIDGTTIEATYLITATGQLNRPAKPNLPGLSSFNGPIFHSAEWRHDIELGHKNIAVVGTGASAIQFVPEIAKHAKSLNLFQRSAPYVIPKPDRKYSAMEHWLLKKLPGTYALSRLKTYLQYESRFLGFRFLKQAMGFMSWSWRRFMHNEVNDETLRTKLTPDYDMGCKRILIANNYYSTLAQANVEVNNTGITSIDEHGIIDGEGQHYPADIIVLGTGFKATDFLSPIRIKGRSGVILNEAWESGAEAYLGINVHQFPNMFMLYGPNTNLGHNSIVYMLESQINYVLRAVAFANKEHASAIEVLAEPQRSFNSTIQHNLKETVWNQGCTSWYQRDDGKNTVNWPGFTFQYRQLTKVFNAENYDLSTL